MAVISLSAKSSYATCQWTGQETLAGRWVGMGVGMVTCPSFADYGGPRCIFVRYPEANGRYMSKELRQAGKKNTRAGPVVTTSQSVGEEKIPRYRARDRIVLRSERHTEDSYLESLCRCTLVKRETLRAERTGYRGNTVRTHAITRAWNSTNDNQTIFHFPLPPSPPVLIRVFLTNTAI